MSRGSTQQRIVQRARGFRVSSRKEKLNIAFKALRQLAQGDDDKSKIARATLLVLGEK